ncbi:MAG TPA: tetratricopeptide repeat protein, partial [Burkholderiaceae bacterium]|nr:tetratricopeptide repeat protein [Burkholderiaceae bacterium]
AAALAAAAAIASAAVSQPLPPPERIARPYEQALALYRAGQLPDALARTERALADAPRDVELRFLRGVLLSELQRRDEAADVFTALTQEFPELPEPHNNLAVIQAARGELHQARESLQNALRAVPDYAVAHENLGDVYLQFAAQSYQQAAKLEPSNRTPANKLALTRELIERLRPATRPAPPPAAPGPAAPAAPIAQ